MPVVDGQNVDAATTNAAFLDAVADDTATGKITLANVDAVSGSSVTNIQREHNSAASFIGKALNSAKDNVPTYTNNQGFTPNDPLLDRLDDVSGKFHNTTGHAHTGASGDAPAIDVLDLSGVQLKGYAVQGSNLAAVTGGSTVVTTELTGETPSTNDTTEGVVVNAPSNLVHLFNANGDSYLDGSGNKVYGRLTESSGTWTLTYYSNVAGVETAYSFSGSNTVQWYYQKLFNESNRPVYSDAFSVVSDQIAGEIPNASTSVKGKTQLASSAPGAIASTGSAGTANGTVANADHTHEGVHSVSKSGDTALKGDVTFTGTGAATLTQSGQNIEINVPAVSGGITQLTGDVTAGPGSGSQAATIASDSVSNAKLANMATQTIKGRTTAGTGDPEDLTATQATAILNTFVGDSGSGGTKGLVPAPASGDAAANKYLKANGTWATVSAGSVGSWASDLTFTPSSGFGTVSSARYNYRIVGDTMEVTGYFVAGTVTGTDAYIDLPSGYTLTTSKLGSRSNSETLGHWTYLPSATVNNIAGVCFYDGSTNNRIFFSSRATSVGFEKRAVNAVFNSSDAISFKFAFPVTTP